MVAVLIPLSSIAIKSVSTGRMPTDAESENSWLDFADDMVINVKTSWDSLKRNTSRRFNRKYYAKSDSSRSIASDSEENCSAVTDAAASSDANERVTLGQNDFVNSSVWNISDPATLTRSDSNRQEKIRRKNLNASDDFMTLHNGVRVQIERFQKMDDQN